MTLSQRMGDNPAPGRLTVRLFSLKISPLLIAQAATRDFLAIGLLLLLIELFMNEKRTKMIDKFKLFEEI